MDPDTIFGLFVYSIVAIGIFIFYLYVKAPSEKEAERLYEEYSRWIHHCSTRKCEIGKIYHIRQRARTGTKASVNWKTRNGSDSVWIKGGHVSNNAIVLLCGEYGHGMHHNEKVYYVSRFEVLPRKIIEGWEIHRSKMIANG